MEPLGAPAARGDGVVVGVGKDLEALADQRLRGAQQLLDIREQRLLVRDHLELHAGGAESFTRELGGAWAPPSRELLDAVVNQLGTL